MAAIAPASSADLLDLIRKSNILSAEQLKALPAAAALPAEPTKAATALLQKGFITRFQAAQLLAGRHKGFRIGPYVIRDLLGRGGMGAVYLGEHLELHRKVAIKVLAPGKGEDQRLAHERFLREARSAAALDHPNIVRIFDVARHNDAPYLVMEHVEGETLQQTIDRDGRVPYEVAAEYVAQAAAGLQHAHEKGLVHRDIKPANLMRDRTGVVKILDMGLARDGSDRDKLTEQLDEGAVVGTADYISPEQAINCPTADGRADIYSLGATLFTLVVGKTPFEGNTTQKLMQHQLRTAPALSEVDAAVPAELSAIVAKMLAKKADERFQTAAEVVAALAPWAATSSRVLAGLSRTKLGDATHAARHDQISGSSRRLLAGAGATTSDSAVDPSDTGAPTGEISAAETVRDHPHRAPEPSAPPRRRSPLVPVLAAAVLVAVVVCCWLAFGRNEAPDIAVVEPPPAAAPAPAPQPQPPAPKPNPVEVPVPPKVEPPVPAERVLSRLDLSGTSPFVIRSVNSVDPADPTKKIAKVLERTGPGAPPTGWQGRSWGKEAEMEYFADDAGGMLALGIRNTDGPASAMLFTPSFDSPRGFCRVKLEYQADVPNRRFSLKFRPNDGRRAWDIAHPVPTGDAWQSAEFVVDMKGATAGMFEFHNTDDQANAVRVRAFAITEPPAGTPPTPVPPSPQPPTGPDYTGWAEGATVYALDVARIPAFRVTKERTTRTAGDAEKLPSGIGCHTWKESGMGEFRRDMVEGIPALGVANLNDVKSAQYYFNLEGSQKVSLRPGQAYRLKVGYRTTGEGAGNATVHVTPGYKGIGTAKLLPTVNQWKTATATFVRAPAADKVEVRMVVENDTVGEGNVLWIRSIEIVELNPPKK